MGWAGGTECQQTERIANPTSRPLAVMTVFFIL
jgi:hypothetical protein